MSIKGNLMANFVSELEAEVLAKKHLENYVNECRCQSKVDVLLAIQKMLAVSLSAHDVVEHGRSETIQ